MKFKSTFAVMILVFATQAMASFTTHCKGFYISANGQKEVIEFTEKSIQDYDPYSNDFFTLEKDFKTSDSRLAVRLYAAKFGDTATYITVTDDESKEEVNGKAMNKDAALVKLEKDGLRFELSCKSKNKRKF